MQSVRQLLLHRRTLRSLQLLGVGIWLVAFFMPCCNSPSWPKDDPFYGWQCAKLTLQMMGPVSKHALIQGWDRVLMVVSGWTNPLLLVYLAASLHAQWGKVRTYFAIAIGACLIASWLFLFVGSGLVVLIGHYLWALGILLIVSPTWLRVLWHSPAENKFGINSAL